MIISSENVHEMCKVLSNPNTHASLMVAFPMQVNGGNVKVGKRSVNLPANIDMTPGSFYIMRVLDISNNVQNPPVIGQCYVMVETNGKLVNSSFCRIDYAYRAVFKTRVAPDVVQAHREADAILSWEERMPQDVRLEYLFTTLKNPSFDAYKWKLTTRDIINGQDATQVEKLHGLWNNLIARQGRSEALVNWLNANPLVTPNTNNMYKAKSAFQQQEPQQVPQQPDCKQMYIRRFPNGFPRRFRGHRQGGQQNPPMAQFCMGTPQQPVGWQQPQMLPNMVWHQPMAYPQFGMVPQQQTPPQYGWPQQPFVGTSVPVYQQVPVNAYGQPQIAQNAVAEGFNQNPEQSSSKMF